MKVYLEVKCSIGDWMNDKTIALYTVKYLLYKRTSFDTEPRSSIQINSIIKSKRLRQIHIIVWIGIYSTHFISHFLNFSRFSFSNFFFVVGFSFHLLNKTSFTIPISIKCIQASLNPKPLSFHIHFIESLLNNENIAIGFQETVVLICYG